MGFSISGSADPSGLIQKGMELFIQAVNFAEAKISKLMYRRGLTLKLKLLNAL
jgi:hypothetical protein